MNKIKGEYALFIFPKSGLGTKHRLILCNEVGIVDADYYNSDNEGHILVKLLYDKRNSNDTLSLPTGKSFVQGILLAYAITRRDKVKTKRNGGFGSTK